MKIALITDQHFGVKNDSPIFLEYQKKFYTETFFPYLKKHKITEVIDLGDTFDRRKYINYNTLSEVKDFYFDVLQHRNINLHIIVGNHSTYYKNSNDINSPDLLLREYSNITNYGEPKQVVFDGCGILMMPWINSENIENCFKTIKESNAHIMFGHFELSDQTLRRNFQFHNGITLEELKKFEHVFSGHYHQKITKGNFKYLGVPYQLTWEDADAEKGFHIFDTETRDITFIKNPHKIYNRIVWNDKGDYDVKKIVDDVSSNCSYYADKYIKIVIKQKSNPYILDRFVEAIEQCNPHNVLTEDIVHHSDAETDSESIERIEDTLTTLRNHINGIENLDNKEDLLHFIETLYNEAITVEE